MHNIFSSLHAIDWMRFLPAVTAMSASGIAVALSSCALRDATCGASYHTAAAVGGASTTYSEVCETSRSRRSVDPTRN